MQNINEQRLETDTQYRFKYVSEFIGFKPEDAAAVQAFAPHLGPRISELVERTYERLLSYDATARHFLPQQHGQLEDAPVALEDLSLDHPRIQFRKDHLNGYFMQLIGRSYDENMVLYLDMVGKMHTTQAGNKKIEIPLIQMNALLGLLSDVLIEAIMESPLDTAEKAKTLRAFNRLLWIQNDLISRHYTAPPGPTPSA